MLKFQAIGLGEGGLGSSNTIWG